MEFKKILQTKQGIAIELSLFFLVSILPAPLYLIIPLLAGISIFSLKTRNLKWVDMGFIKTDFNSKNILTGVVLAVTYFFIFQFLVDPLLNQWFPAADLTALGIVKGDYQKLIIWLVTTWIIAAVFEEFLFRGYLVNRLEDLLGTTSKARIITVIFSAIPFAFVHAYQGKQGMVTAGIFGIFQASIFLLKNKRLTIPMIAHGTFDTIGFTRLF